MENFIKRTIFEDLKSHLKQKEISLIVGPRQAGKTTLMLLLKEYLERKGQKIIFFNLDIEADRQFFTSQAKLLRKIQLEIGKGKGYVFIDEIQRKENAGIFLKGLYDMNPPYKFIVSGSGSLELKEGVHESLVGRKIIFELSTLSFLEFTNFRTNYRYEKNLSDFFDLDPAQGRAILEEYLNFGGYPRVALAETEEQKRKEINEIYQSYLERDISYFLGVQKEESFSNLVRLLAAQIGNLTNYSELASTLGISLKTVKNYLWYLEKTFILNKVTPYFRNVRKEITKAPLFYFSDLGLRNYAAGEFRKVMNIREQGFLFENFIFLILKNKIALKSSTIHFWRSKDGAEVDFLLNWGKEVVPLEVKARELKESQIEPSLRSFLSKYKPCLAFVVNLSFEDEIKIGKTRVHFLPFYKTLFKSLRPK